MSGHSKWSTIKHKKAATDKRRSAIFAKLAKSIPVVARQGGGDPETNYALRTEIEKAKSLNLPKDKIEQAIKRGTGEDKDGIQLEELMLEALGPGGVALLIEAITDNRNRTNAEIRHLMALHGGKIVGEGSVTWQFTRYGALRVPTEKIKDKEAFELTAIEGNAEDFQETEEFLVVYTAIENLQKMLAHLEANGYDGIATDLEWVAKNKVEISEKEGQQLEKIFEILDEHDDVQNIYTNAA